MEIIMNMGTFLAYAGVAIAVILSGMGSSKGVGYVGEAMSGVIAEDPGKFAQLLVLQALPATQGIYGFITGFLVIMRTGMLDGSIGQLTLGTGAYFFAACLPVAFVGYVSGKCQAVWPPLASASSPRDLIRFPRAWSPPPWLRPTPFWPCWFPCCSSSICLL